MDTIKEGLDTIIEELENNTENGVSFIWKGTVPKSILNHPQLKVEMVTRNISHITVVEVSAIDFDNTSTRRTVKQFFRTLMKINNFDKKLNTDRLMQQLQFKQNPSALHHFYFNISNEALFKIVFKDTIQVTYEVTKFGCEDSKGLTKYMKNVDSIYDGVDFEIALKELINYCLVNEYWRKGK